MLVIQLIEAKTNTPIDTLIRQKGGSPDANPFTDTSDRHVAAAYQLGVVTGRGAGEFAPNASITRQEAAVMLRNTAAVLEVDVPVAVSSFVDTDDIAPWAAASVDFVFSAKVMDGTGDGRFSPQGIYTPQQAYITILRLLAK